MARPKMEIRMARCAGKTLLAAVEIYNKPTVEYREQTFAVLVTNAWEVLLKGRLVQKADGKIETIYRRQSRSRLYERDEDTREPITIGLRKTLSRVSLPSSVSANVQGLMAIRNTAVHLGVLLPRARKLVLKFGTASVHNFIELSSQWFGETVQIPYLLPVGFIGDATGSTHAYPRRQRDLVNVLDELSRTSSGTTDSRYSVVMHVEIALNWEITGGGSIGITNDPRAPTVRITDDEALRRFSHTYQEIEAQCRDRYSDFKRNSLFYQAMRDVKADGNCAYARRLDPTNASSQTKWFYDPQTTFTKLDDFFTARDLPSTTGGRET